MYIIYGYNQQFFSPEAYGDARVKSYTKTDILNISFDKHVIFENGYQI